MNHDYEHCLDYNADCPKECYRGQLVRDLQANGKPMIVSWMSFEGTDECIKRRNNNAKI